MRQLITSLIAVLVAANLQAQQQHAPKLVVCITIDQLRGDYLEYFKNSFGERGFKRLLNEGVVYSHVQFEFSNIDQASSFATLFTGSNPCYHSITGITRYDFEKEQERSCLYDAHYLGNYTHQNFSPKNMLSSTIGDELKIASKGASLVYAIAPEAECAIISAGHAADGAFWLDNYNGKWATTTFYKNIPQYVDKLNNGTESLSSRLSSVAWSPMLPSGTYSTLPYITDKKQYNYKFNEKEVGCYPRFKTSPFINKEVGKLAAQFINSGELGSHQTPDLLNVTFYGGNFLDVQDKTYTREVQDVYFQLDKNIEELLDAIDKKVGLSHTLVVVTGTGYYTDTEAIPDGETLIGGTFHPKRCTALLNMYLRSIYGQKNWVRGYYNQQLFLNRKTIEDEKLDLNVIQNKAAEFIAEFSGVQQVTTDLSLRSGDWNEGSAALRYGTFHIGRGDLIIELQPGWGVEDDITGQKVKAKRNNTVITPVIFIGNHLKPKRIERTVYATEIAPTVTNVLRIRAPNACSDLPLSEIK
ncbi:MAG: alkaline phosphatase family protein [Tannerella sp.]|nr:alkaline phosphatase family protein [Tannerella sp.]